MATSLAHSSPVAAAEALPLLCFSPLRWDFVRQRPQHLMARHARRGRVAFLEEPRFQLGEAPRLDVLERDRGVQVLVPVLPPGLAPVAVTLAMRLLLDEFLRVEGIKNFVSWYCTPMALQFTRHLKPELLVYDCMDELSGVRGASPELAELERQLMERADVVFTGGYSLYEAKRDLHPNVHALPSSVDVGHFQRAVLRPYDPPDQAVLPRPRLGFFGVIDERLDLELLAGVADARPDWQIVMLGPLVKIGPLDLPQRPNIHYLGPVAYDDLPDYASGWDVGILPLAHSEATRFMGPTKTAEYLAAGLPVVSTPIYDVIEPYGERGLVRIAETPMDFVDAVEKAMDDARHPEWSRNVRALMSTTSWERTFARMTDLMAEARDRRLARAH